DTHTVSPRRRLSQTDTALPGAVRVCRRGVAGRSADRCQPPGYPRAVRECRRAYDRWTNGPAPAAADERPVTWDSIARGDHVEDSKPFAGRGTRAPVQRRASADRGCPEERRQVDQRRADVRHGL